ncbi:hypothetical protein Y1Q_0013675 [Alligator mississippiensis]|uniref:Uncharacterized protein n=1 Tax=Alligator mississippiensis TaxID=8496 RepID=A0A151P3Q5_ALLMI|nr:hypothetical protein Y1Q_0013675 [Alligator mississippiensis]
MQEDVQPGTSTIPDASCMKLAMLPLHHEPVQRCSLHSQDENPCMVNTWSQTPRPGYAATRLMNRTIRH